MSLNKKRKPTALEVQRFIESNEDFRKHVEGNTDLENIPPTTNFEGTESPFKFLITPGEDTLEMWVNYTIGPSYYKVTL